MFTYETADQKEVRRFRIAQFNGRMATVSSGEATVTGFVRSVLEQESSMPPRWTITIIPNVPKEEIKPLRPSSRSRPFAEDYF
jgi:precorrin-3B methylase